MTDDLVKRLRERDAAGGDYCTEWGEAADRIENLNYQIKVIQGAAAHAQKSYEEHLAVYRQKLDEKPPVWHDHIQSLQERDAIMTDRIEKLEAALREIDAVKYYGMEGAEMECKEMHEIARKALGAE